MGESPINTIQAKLQTIFKQYPNQVAIEYGTETMSYQELDHKSNQVAAAIIQNGGAKGSFIGVLTSDKIDLLLALLGILKAGCVFVPIDPLYPIKRIESMIRAIDMGYILIDEPARRNIVNQLSNPGLKLNFLYMAQLDQGKPENPTAAPEVDYHPEDMIYVYFTSGSTGEPKAILGKNKSLLHFIDWEIQTFQLDHTYHISQFTSQCHDPFLRDVFAPLCSGGRICIPVKKEIMLETASMIHWIEQSEIDLIHCTPSLFKIFNAETLHPNNFPKLKYVLLAGEKVNPRDLRNWYNIFGSRIQLVNLYGPTETTLAKLCYFITPADPERKNMPIGKPVSGARAIILNENMQICDRGIAGEIYIRTPFRTFGYYKSPELNAQKFITNPFNNDPNDLIFKTGDLGRMLDDDNIEFIGRIDRQIKIRGFRVELGDIENILANHQAVKDAIVIAKEEPNRDLSLCAYVVIQNQAAPDGATSQKQLGQELKGYLTERLPDYMIPRYIGFIETIPQTANGKIDYKSLPELKDDLADEYAVPKNEIEVKLIKIWSQILNREQVGVNVNFLNAGGHSLNAMTLISMVHQEFDVELPLEEIFYHGTIEELAQYIRQAAKSIYHSIEPLKDSEYYPASSSQKRMFILSQFDGAQTQYNLPQVFIIEGPLDRAKLESAFGGLIFRHEALRTSFLFINSELVQRVHPEVEFKVDHIKAPEDVGENADQINTLINGYIKPFALDEPPLLRAGLVKLSDTKHILIFDMHHIISDMISLNILVRDFTQLYQGTNLPPLKIQYKDFSVWQNEQMNSGFIKKQEEYWLKRFSGAIPALNLATDFPRPSIQSFEGYRFHFTIQPDPAARLKKIALEAGATVYMLLLAAVNVLLFKYTDQEDIVIGSPIAGRPHAQLADIVGMFVNTLALRNYPVASKTFKEFLEEVKENALEAYENQDYQFEELIEKLKVQRNISRNPLFDVLLALQNTAHELIELAELRFTPYVIEQKTSKFDLSFFVAESDEGISFNLEYCAKLFQPETIARLAGNFQNLLQTIAAEPERKLAELEILSASEKRQILREFNSAPVEYPREKTIVQLFEEQVERNPDQVAVAFDDQQLTYQELNQKANQLGRVLRREGIQTNSIVGIMAERSLEMMIGLLGILKAGAAYLPIDPNYPAERIAYLLEDSQVSLLLRQVEAEGAWGSRTIDLRDSSLFQGDSSNLNVIHSPEDLAYVIYTSGSTGRPKGSLIEQHALVNRLNWMQKQYPIGEQDVILQKTPYTFDVSVWELFWWGISGARLCFLRPGGEKDPAEILETVARGQATTMHFVPSMLQIFLAYLEGNRPLMKRLGSLRQVFASGEALLAQQVQLFYRLFDTGTVRLINLYGPTEATIDVSYFDCSNGANGEGPSPPLGIIPIGRPIDNIQLYILNQTDQLQPAGVPGELCIAGVGLARGYLNRPELTAEKFVLWAPQGSPQRIYRTGDLARRAPDGNIEFIGRIDNQVKIRGFRIELGEIETQMLKYPLIKEATVIAKKDSSGNNYLCAYFVPVHELAVSELRKYLLRELPEYMIPTYLVPLDRLPLTANGKVDRKGLPAPEESVKLENEYLVPSSELEKKLVAFWEAILGVPKIGIHDNFFELGGHSLKAATFVARVQQELNIVLPLIEIFRTPTIQKLAEYIEAAACREDDSIQPAPVREYYPASWSQKGMYITNQFEDIGTNFNMPVMFMIEGQLDRARLENALYGLIMRHEALRTSFELIDGELAQKIALSVDFKINYAQSTADEVAAIIKSFIQPFNLSKAPLLRVMLLQLASDRHVFIGDLHHIISDGLSMGILVRDFADLYEGKKLPPLKLQYKDYSVWQNELFHTGKMKPQEEYWLRVLGGIIPRLNMPTDLPRPATWNMEGGKVFFELNSEITSKLREIALGGNSTLFILVLAIYNTLLYKYTGQEDLIIGTAAAGRRQAGLENIIGMFVNTLVMRNSPSGSKTFESFSQEVRENTLTAYSNQEYPFELLVKNLNLNRSKDRGVLVDVKLSFNNFFAQEFRLSDLKFIPYNKDEQTTTCDLFLDVHELNDSLRCCFIYAKSLFKPESIVNLATDFQAIAAAVCNNPAVKLNEIALAGAGERAKDLAVRKNRVNEFVKELEVFDIE